MVKLHKIQTSPSPPSLVSLSMCRMVYMTDLKQSDFYTVFTLILCAFQIVKNEGHFFQGYFVQAIDDNAKNGGLEEV